MSDPWTLLTDEWTGETSIVVPSKDTDPALALVELVQQIAGVDCNKETPTIVKEAANLKVDRWWAYSKRLKAQRGIDEYQDYYGTDGDLKTGVWVVTFDGDVTVLGEAIESGVPA